MNIKRISGGLVAAFATVLAVPALASAATTTTTVTGTNQAGFQFNRDTTTATPYEFNEDESSIGEGSLYVKPIGTTNPNDKFVAEKALGILVTDLTSISYDFQIAGNGTAADANDFYLNVYTNLPGSNTFYDCRYDFVPATGSTTSFTTANFAASSSPSFIGDRSGDSYTCPATLAELEAGSTVKFFAVNVGDTSASDAGLAGYLDNIVVTTTNDKAIYDLEKNLPKPVKALNKDDCKDGGYKNFQTAYKNQGDCVSSVASQGKAKGNPKEDTSVLASIRKTIGL